MTANKAAKQVRRWFRRGHLPSLELPDGWFGRPYDNCHALSHLEVIGDRLLIGLDGQQLLVLTRPEVTNVTDSDSQSSGNWKVEPAKIVPNGIACE